MTLADALSQPLPALGSLRGLWLIFDADLLIEFDAAQEGAKTFLAAPTTLTDGRFALCADLLTEIGTGGVYAEAFAKLPAEKFGEVEVVPFAEISDLMPKSEEE